MPFTAHKWVHIKKMMVTVRHRHPDQGMSQFSSFHWTGVGGATTRYSPAQHTVLHDFLFTEWPRLLRDICSNLSVEKQWKGAGSEIGLSDYCSKSQKVKRLCGYFRCQREKPEKENRYERPVEKKPTKRKSADKVLHENETKSNSIKKLDMGNLEADKRYLRN